MTGRGLRASSNFEHLQEILEIPDHTSFLLPLQDWLKILLPVLVDVHVSLNVAQCTDINECNYVGACGRAALCINVAGGHRCECPEGYNGNPEEECVDVDECLRSPCGRSADCTNMRGSFRCSCPEGTSGDPWVGCHGE